MKPKFHQVPKLLDTTFSIRHDIVPTFGTTWHYHPEVELHYLIKGRGIRFIGENINNFETDELILLGSNIPHTWKCNTQSPEDHVEALVMHFHPDCLGTEFTALPEAKKLQKFLSFAKQGIIYHGETKLKALKLMKKINKSSGLSKIIYLLKIFDLLSNAEEYEVISSQYNSISINKIDEQRLNKILTYTFTNFKRKIYIEDIADLSNLSVTSFCRYFKATTKKSYFDFLTEIRISYACRLLIDSDYQILTIAEESGFENTSNFYRHFKKFKQSTPNEYKRNYLLNIHEH